MSEPIVLKVGDHVKVLNKWGSLCTYRLVRRLEEASTNDWADPLLLDPVPHTVEAEPLTEQVRRLAEFITENFDGEPSRSEGAIDTAIRLLTPPEPHDITVEGGEDKRVIIRCSCGAVLDTTRWMVTWREVQDYIERMDHRP